LKDSPTYRGKEVYMQLSKEAVWLKWSILEKQVIILLATF
jgi:Fe-S cluster biosynthesis and repair protein YggX